ncbi:MAG: hypothetical protein JOY69_02870, partial [Candidatus Eremiobacteraeota bacterium]|nr:hypothetical protein [Candidatus Eremiobacteraeota bacterium]
MTRRGKRVAFLFVCGLAGCSGSSGGMPSPAAGSPPPIARDHLYVAEAHAVVVYDTQTGAIVRSIMNSAPRCIVFDAGGSLFVANDQTNSVTVYAPGGNSVARTIATGVKTPKALAFDAAGNLYVANQPNSISVYAPGATTPFRTIT